MLSCVFLFLISTWISPVPLPLLSFWIYHLASRFLLVFISIAPWLVLSGSLYAIESIQAFLDIKQMLPRLLPLHSDNVHTPQCGLQGTTRSWLQLTALMNLYQIRALPTIYWIVTLTLAGEPHEVLWFCLFLFCSALFLCVFSMSRKMHF